MQLQSTNRDERARDLRDRQTKSEAIFWEHLRNRRFQKLKFRRQRPIGPYFADFCSEELTLVVEIDGGIHNTPEAREYDAVRDEYIRMAGYRILRLAADDVENKVDKVRLQLAEVVREMQNLPSPPAPLPLKG